MLDLLEPVVGRDNVRASVTAEIDFSQVMQTAEAYQPNQGPDAKAAVREQRSEESSQPGGGPAGGVPGATSNQPPVPATAPVNGPAQALQGAAGSTGAAGSAGRREAATHYEVDKTVRVTRNATGTVRRLIAAVVVNNHVSVDAKGKTVSTPLTPEELDKLTALVQREHRLQRGARRRRQGGQRAVPRRGRAGGGSAAAVAAALADRPGARRRRAGRAGPGGTGHRPQADPPGAHRDARPATDAAARQPARRGGRRRSRSRACGRRCRCRRRRETSALDAARALAKSNPAAVAHIVRGWVNGEAA